MKAKSPFYFIVLFGALMLMLPAFRNGYPLLNPDDNTYLVSGFLPETPFDRPITYGLLLRAFSLNGLSLWFAAFAQAWMLSWLIVATLKRLRPELLNGAMPYLFYLVLGCCTGLSWVSSELIPDVCTAAAFLSLFLLLFHQEKKSGLVLLYALFTINVSTHFSNVMILMLMIGVVFLLRKRIAVRAGLRNLPTKLAVAAVLCLATIATMGSALSKSKHVFFTGAMLEQGILQTYLQERCPVDSFKICAYQKALRRDANWFLWDGQSPLYQTGGWAANKAEYSRIINATLTEPKYIWLHIRASVWFTARQFTRFGVGDGNVPFNEGTTIHATVGKYLPGDANRFASARQQQGTLLAATPLLNAIQYSVVLLSLLFLTWAFCFRRRDLPFEVRSFVLLALLLILVNNWDCATFAQVNGRYGCRVMWLMTFSAWLLVPYVIRKAAQGKAPDIASPTRFQQRFLQTGQRGQRL